MPWPPIVLFQLNPNVKTKQTAGLPDTTIIIGLKAQVKKM